MRLLYAGVTFILFVTVLMAAHSSAASPLPAGMPAAVAGYSVVNGQIRDEAGNPVQLRGINVFGFNSQILLPAYLWAMGWKQQIQQIRDLGFNAVRLPFVPETLYSTARVNEGLKTYVDPRLNADLVGKTPLEVLDLWMDEAERQGLYVVLDFHSVSSASQYFAWHIEDPQAYGAGKWAHTYNGQPYSTADWIRDLRFVAARYAAHPHFIGIDLFNEPNSVVRWGPGDRSAYKPENDWKLAADAAAEAVLAVNPRLLIFVEGIDCNWDGIERSDVPTNFGEDLQPLAYRPLAIPRSKLVLSPHTYGPDGLYQFPKSSFSDPAFPANLVHDWDTLFGRYYPDYAVVIGEFGGYYGTGPSRDKDRQWQDALVSYLVGKGMRSAFYWTYTPNSYNTGGILDNELSVRHDKLELLHRLFGLAS
jgi:aryl-phospho-beta-D-glucosidase BglC (GH1 family)